MVKVVGVPTVTSTVLRVQPPRMSDTVHCTAYTPAVLQDFDTVAAFVGLTVLSSKFQW